jgi:pimeloyl-ACP methyl ester carboxylesterase
VGRTVSPLLRLAAVPGVEALMPLLGLPPVRAASRIGAGVLRLLNTALGRDAQEIQAVFDSLPNTEARRAILRTLRSGGDWRGQVITKLDRAYLAEGVPTLIVWGRHDAIIPLGHGRMAHAALPGSELEIFDDAGHFPHHTDPERFARVVRRFVEETTPNRFDREGWRTRLLRGKPPPSDVVEPPGAPPPNLDVSLVSSAEV